MNWPVGLLLGLILAAGALLLADYFHAGTRIVNISPRGVESEESQRLAERIGRAKERSQQVKGVYVSSTVANDRGRAATQLRNNIIALLESTELNGVVIDTKGGAGDLIITDALRELIAQLHAKRVWVIARQVVFKDSFPEQVHPEWYLKQKSGAIWRDTRGGSWLDPASPEVWRYQIQAAKAASDAGFDEIQFDYIRFPSDGDVRSIVYPVYDPARPKYEVLGQFFAYLHDELKRHRPDLILSLDLFGSVALQQADLGIGQRLEDIRGNFDYISLMVYPSHYYAGFEVPRDALRNLPALSYPYRSSDVSLVAANHPYEVVERSLLIASDILAGRATGTDAAAGSGRRTSALDGSDTVKTVSSTTSTPTIAPAGRAKLRPWLQNFDLAVDSARGIRYDAKKVRAQIDAAEAVSASGWLLWSPDNIYTQEALKPE